MTPPRTVTVSSVRWPPRPEGEVFPEVMATQDVAMLLRYDAREGMTREKGARMVRLLVRDRGLPTLGRVGRALLFRKSAVMKWLEGRGNSRKGVKPTDSVSDAQDINPDSTGVS